MNGYLKQATAGQVRTIGPFIDDGDFKTLENGLTIANTDILLKKNGAASAAKNSGGATADGSGGLYHLTLDATDTNTVGELSFSVKVAGALVVFGSFCVLEEAVYDALFAASAPGYLDAAGVRAAVGLAGANLDAQLGDLPTNAEFVAAVPTAVQNREEMDSNSTRLASIDGKTTNLPTDPADQSLVIAAADAISGAIAALNNLSAAQVRTELAVELGRLDEAVSTRLASAGYTTPPTAVENADAYLKRDMAAVTGEASRSPLNALRFSRNKFTVIDDVLTVYKEDDTTIAWTAVITKTAGNPVSASDPA